MTPIASPASLTVTLMVMGVSSIDMDGCGNIKKKADDTATANCVP